MSSITFLILCIAALGAICVVLFYNIEKLNDSFKDMYKQEELLRNRMDGLYSAHEYDIKILKERTAKVECDVVQPAMQELKKMYVENAKSISELSERMSAIEETSEANAKREAAVLDGMQSIMDYNISDARKAVLGNAE